MLGARLFVSGLGLVVDCVFCMVCLFVCVWFGFAVVATCLVLVFIGGFALLDLCFECFDVSLDWLFAFDTLGGV